MAVSREEVLKIAALARLRLTPEEVERYSAQLGTILDHIGLLSEVEEAAPPVESVEWPAPLREDGGRPDTLGLPPRELAPAWEEGFFAVPRLPALDTTALEDAFEDEARVGEVSRSDRAAGRAEP
jgi:aspartyl-tRNA(Asn)/glutamyl-tRNA(Gln) amidotransferase subunit C